MLIPACVSCMGMLRVVQYAYSKCVCVCVCVCLSERKRDRKEGRDKKEGESKGISKGIKPKPQDISDLEGERVKQGGGRKERRKRNREES